MPHLIAGYFLGLIAALFFLSLVSLEGGVFKERNCPQMHSDFRRYGCWWWRGRRCQRGNRKGDINVRAWMHLLRKGSCTVGGGGVVLLRSEQEE
jgi:hypothetical protein